MVNMKEVQMMIEEVLERNLDILLERHSEYIGEGTPVMTQVVDVDKVRAMHRNAAANLAQILECKRVNKLTNNKWE